MHTRTNTHDSLWMCDNERTFASMRILNVSAISHSHNENPFDKSGFHRMGRKNYLLNWPEKYRRRLNWIYSLHHLPYLQNTRCLATRGMTINFRLRGRGRARIFFSMLFEVIGFLIMCIENIRKDWQARENSCFLASVDACLTWSNHRRTPCTLVNISRRLLYLYCYMRAYVSVMMMAFTGRKGYALEFKSIRVRANRVIKRLANDCQDQLN